MIQKREFKDYSGNWVQTATSVVALAFAVLLGFGIITPEQATQGQPEVTNVLGNVSSLIASVIALIGIFFKPKV